MQADLLDRQTRTQPPAARPWPISWPITLTPPSRPWLTSPPTVKAKPRASQPPAPSLTAPMAVLRKPWSWITALRWRCLPPSSFGAFHRMTLMIETSRGGMIFSAQSLAHRPFVQIRKGVLPADRDAGSRDAVCPATDSATQGGFVRMGDAEKQSQPNPNRHAHHGACAFPKKCDRLTTATRARDQKARIPRQAGARWGIFWGYLKQINQQ